MDDDLPPLPAAAPGRYRHYKGGEYELVGVARHSETPEPLVIYRPLHNATGLWARPYEMFFGELEVGGAMQRERRAGDAYGTCPDHRLSSSSIRESAVSAAGLRPLFR